jgi:oligopeptide transport system permease protein
VFSYILKRLAIAVPTLLLLIVISFLLMHSATGGPIPEER